MEIGNVEDFERAVRDLGNAVVVMAAAASLELGVERFGVEHGDEDIVEVICTQIDRTLRDALLARRSSAGISSLIGSFIYM